MSPDERLVVENDSETIRWQENFATIWLDSLQVANNGWLVGECRVEFHEAAKKAMKKTFVCPKCGKTEISDKAPYCGPCGWITMVETS